MEIRECLICKNKDLTPVFQVDKFPYVGFSVTKEEKSSILKRYSTSRLSSTLKIVSCNRCYHAFQPIEPDKEIMDMIYSECYNYPSPMLSGFAQERENIFLQFFLDNVEKICKEKGLKEILEIACYDGYILNELSKRGYNVCGCDPSKGADIAKSFGINVYQQYFEGSYFIKKNKFFDIILFRHFIEHVRDPVCLLSDVEQVLSEDGLVIFETPNVEYYFENGSFETFGLQHIQNFSLHSVEEILGRASLRLIDYKITPENLIVVAARSGGLLSYEKSLWEKHVSGFRNNFQRNVDHFMALIKPFLEQDKRIVLWGAGGFCGLLFALYGVNEKDISYVVDSDNRKWDMCFIDIGLEICPPGKLLTDTVDLIIITSMYSREIIKQIHEMKIKADVISLHPIVNRLTNSMINRRN